MEKEKTTASNINPLYLSGKYFDEKHERHRFDAQFKAKRFAEFILQVAHQEQFCIRSYVDVGCGTGEIVNIVATLLKKGGHDIASVKGYDVAPQTRSLQNEGVDYICQDFCLSNENADLVTLFDVIEHVPNPIGFFNNVASRCNMIGVHVPLEDNIHFSLRDKFRVKLKNTGHLLYMDVTYALNLFSLSGLQVVDYRYIDNFLAPTGHLSLFSKLMVPVRSLLFKISPWLLSRTLGGVSLMVLALTPKGSKNNQINASDLSREPQ